ncbi:hypothetical protein D3C72_1499440 [compost metagenome]
MLAEAPGARVGSGSTLPMAYKLVPTFFVKMSRLAFSGGTKADTKKCCEIANQPPFAVAGCKPFMALSLPFFSSSTAAFSIFSNVSFWYLSCGVYRVGPVKLLLKNESPTGLLPSCVSCRYSCGVTGAAPTLATSWRTSMT